MYSTLVDLTLLLVSVYFLNKLGSNRHRFIQSLCLFFLSSTVALFLGRFYEVSKSFEGYLLFTLLTYSISQFIISKKIETQEVENKSQTLISNFISIATLSFLISLFTFNYLELNNLVERIPGIVEFSSIHNSYFYPSFIYLVSVFVWILYTTISKSPYRIVSTILVLALSMNIISSKFHAFQIQFTLPTIISLSPDLVSKNQEVLLKGVNFGTGGGESAVLMNNIKHEVVSWSDTKIIFKTNPQDSRSGYVKIQNASGKDSVSVIVKVRNGND